MNSIFFLPNQDHLFDTFKYSVLALDKEPFKIGIGAFSNEPYIYYNTEQLTRVCKLNQLLRIIQLTRPVLIWDYSFANAEILKLHNVDSKVVPLKSPMWYIEKLKSSKKDLYDVGFCGCLSERRLKILDDLKSKNFKVNVITCYGETRDLELAKCKIILNIHYASDYRVFESNRCEPFLQAGFIVISENSLDNDSRCLNVDYDQLVAAVTTALASAQAVPISDAVTAVAISNAVSAPLQTNTCL